jgi:hypothetical protein
MTDKATPTVIASLAVLGEVLYWLWLFIGVRRGHYPVTFIGWVSLISDPILAVIGLIAVISWWKYRSRDI